MKKISLWNLGEELDALDEMLCNLDAGEIEVSHEELEKEVMELIKVKTDNIVEYSKMLKAEIDSAAVRIKEFTEYKSKISKRLDRLKEYSLACLEKSDFETFRGEFYQISSAKPRDTLVVTDLEKIDPDYLAYKVEVKNKTELFSAYKKGSIEQSGFEIVKGKRSVSFKMKTKSKK